MSLAWTLGGSANWRGWNIYSLDVYDLFHSVYLPTVVVFFIFLYLMKNSMQRALMYSYLGSCMLQYSKRIPLDFYLTKLCEIQPLALLAARQSSAWEAPGPELCDCCWLSVMIPRSLLSLWQEGLKFLG